MTDTESETSKLVNFRNSLKVYQYLCKGYDIETIMLFSCSCFIFFSCLTNSLWKLPSFLLLQISVPSERAVELCKVLLSSKLADVRLAGLGARDSLRLEAGMCLYGNDLEEDITPVQASLTWLIGRFAEDLLL